MQTRRQFVAGAGVTAAATVLAPQAVVLGQSRRAPLLRGGRFSQGVMSGEPTTRSIVRWSQVEGVERSGTVRLEVARDRDFRRVVARELIGTDGNIAHTVKARVTGLRPAERYYYRFETATEQSPVGRFKTAPPADSNEPIRFAFFSCAEYTHGFYNAYAAMAREDDLDFVVCLGDYIYESPLNPQSETGPYTTVRRDTVGEANSVAEYRDKYRLYRSDPGLRAVHRNFPLVTIWDDHEVEDNYAGGDPSSEDYDPNRRRAGYRAWFENMPIYPTGSRRGDRIYRSLRFGRNVELLMLDQRQYRDNQPCNDRPGPKCPEVDQPRNYLGRNQMRWTKDRLQASQATWKVIGNELPIYSTRAGESYIPEFDAWGNGYPVERQELLTHIRDKRINDVAFITGDVHYFAAADVRVDESDANTVVAHDFVGGSISSASPGESKFDLGGGLTLQGNDENPDTPAAVMNALEGFNPWIDAADIDHHGYGLVEATRGELDVRMRRMATVKKRSNARLKDMRWTVKRGQKSILGQNKSTDF
jgi:alkaline phosphatase D